MWSSVRPLDRHKWAVDALAGIEKCRLLVPTQTRSLDVLRGRRYLFGGTYSVPLLPLVCSFRRRVSVPVLRPRSPVVPSTSPILGPLKDLSDRPGLSGDRTSFWRSRPIRPVSVEAPTKFSVVEPCFPTFVTGLFTDWAVVVFSYVPWDTPRVEYSSREE